MNKNLKFTLYIFLAMVLGIVVGLAIKHNLAADKLPQIASYLKLLSKIFILMVKMIIAPLVFSTLVVGIAKLGDTTSVGRVMAKAMAWFITASLASLSIGLVIVNYFKPGEIMRGVEANTKDAAEMIKNTEGFSIDKFVEHVFPSSIAHAMAQNEILQIVVFSLFFGIACASIGDYAKPIVRALDSLSHVILKMVNYVMKFAPIGVFGAIAAVFAIMDWEKIVKFYTSYLGSFLFGIGILWIILLLAGYLLLKSRLGTLLQRIGQPLLIAFSTTSSEAVFPKLTEELERFGVNKKLVSFILPLGYSFNLDGSMMYMTFASMAIAQANNISMTGMEQLTMLLVLMLTSKGVAGVPRASLVVVTATCAMFNIPAEGIALILPIDHVCDMFRSTTNVLGNALATCAVDKWEKMPEDTDIEIGNS
jgi:Na+/H+-dicarboxylate symporter